nr:MAG TPA: ASCH domain protein [Caudoviricetes sp.]
MQENKLSGKGTWESNPYVWVYDFELGKKWDLE